MKTIESRIESQNWVMDTWVAVSWQDFLDLADQPELQRGKFYYDQNLMRIELLPIGPLHGHDNSVIARTISLFATLNNIPIMEYLNTSFRHPQVRECQPDVAYYIGSELKLPPRNDSPVDVTEFDPPTLAVEIASTTLNDDLGRKRLLYERLGVQEYWVVDAKLGEVIVFAVADGGSKQIPESQVLPGLGLKVVLEALERSQREDDGAVNRWLLEVFREVK
ncbi:MAG: Uma2 family endonuclease [Oscillatoriales cyanobacterium RM2_1_1]|nr:Uma2 family endonuclease [Oscillatoriales cyanobacterium SM2_3_0]NJO44458.1 Uma2 family endonuclease [Oscillatoriales cyanobacterium RM2_1_1]